MKVRHIKRRRMQFYGTPRVRWVMSINRLERALNRTTNKFWQALGRVEGDLVPDGYWDVLGAAFDKCQRLPAADLSRDPPVFA